MRNITVSDYFVEFLIANGVTDVFGYQGGMIAYIFDSLGRYSNQIRYHSCATEQGAAFAACGYAQATQNIGVAISTSGPGFTNLVTGIADAWFDSVPVLFVSGNVNTKDKKRNMSLRQLGFQEIQAASIANNITKKSYEIELNTNYIKTFDEAYTVAMSDRKGPVYIDLPINVCREVIQIENVAAVKINSTTKVNVTPIIEELINSKKPIIIAGAGIKQSGNIEKFRKLINVLKIPVVTTLPGIDVLPSDSPYMMGYIGGTARREAGIALQNSDYVLSIGTRLCSKQIGHNLSLFAPKALKFYRVDIDESEFERKIKENEVQVHCGISDFLDEAIEYVEKSYHISQHKYWSDACTNMKYLLKNSDITIGNDLVSTITKMLPDDANVVWDVGKNTIYCGQSSVIKENTRIYLSAGLGTMGYAIPAAIGAWYGNQKPTYVITGDGGAQMNIQELNTIIKNKIPIKIIVLNNKALGNIRIFQEQYLDSRFVATSEKEGDYFACDFRKISIAYGIEAYTLYEKEELEKYRDTLQSDNSILLEIIYEDCPVLPGIVAGGDFLQADSGIEKGMIIEIDKLME